MNNDTTDNGVRRFASFKSPKMLALGVPLVFLGQCAPNGCTPVPGPPPAAITVTDVIDGDTVDLSNGERVRLVGIDAPEAGQCGSGEATARLEALVLHHAVSLTAGARDDRDGYGRLLRYVETATTDAGLDLIQQGLAVARYDSRDGYGRHDREASYVAADAGSPVGYGCGTPPPPAGNCEPSYPTLCLRPGVDVDCGEIPHRNFPVLPPDPFRLDGNDNDGIGCES